VNYDSAIIGGKLHIACDRCPRLVPFDGSGLCGSCMSDEWSASLSNPEQWHPYGPLCDHHDRARDAHLTAGLAGLETP
jgi:hypothetical protein